MYAYITCTELIITVRKNVKAGEESLKKQISYGDVGAVMQKLGSRERLLSQWIKTFRWTK